MTFQFLRFELDAEGIALLTINRPEKLNALNRPVIEELAEAFREVREISEVKGLILTGAGEKAFAAGADIAEVAAANSLAAEQLSRFGQQVFRQLETMRKPSVAAINGFALGGGLELALCATVRFAASNAKMGTPEVRLGLVPGYGATQRLPRFLGRAQALHMLLSGEPVGAAEAYRVGLVQEVVEPALLIDTARAWLRKVIANAPVAVGFVMDAVDAGLEMGLEAGLRFESAAFGLVSSSEDKHEGTQAFLEKRKALFTGR